eukprot:s2744_g15.t1
MSSAEARGSQNSAAAKSQTSLGSRQQSPAPQRRSSLRQFGKIVFGDNFPSRRDSRPSRRRSHQSSASASSHLSTAGSLILREFSSTASLGEGDQASCIMAKVYRVPHHVLKRGFARLEMRFSPDSHGEIRASLILTTLRIFDEYFHTGRSRAERHWLVDRLETSMHDFTKKKWNADELLNAFGVKMNMCERIYFTVDVSGTSNLLSRFVSGFMVITIIISIAVWMAGTIPRYTVVQCPSCEPEPLPWMQVVDEVCVIIFTTEFLIRMLTAPFARAKLLQGRFLLKLLFDRDIKAEEKENLESEHDEEESEDVEIEKERFSWISNWLSFWRQPNAIVDLFTVLPYWVEVVFATSADSNFIWLRLFRLLRVSRIFKLLQLVNSDLWQLSDAQHLLYNVMIQAAPAFAITLALLGFALLVFSSLMYVAERGNWYPVSVIDGASNATEFVNFSQIINLPAVQHEASRSGGVFLRELPNGFLEMTPFTSILVCSWWTLPFRSSFCRASLEALKSVDGSLCPLGADECTDPATCSLELLHMRGNYAESDAKVDYQPGRETGVSCMWSGCDSAKLGMVECHHWRCICQTTARWSSDLKTCVKAEEPAEGQDTGGTCGWFACSKTRGPTRCEGGKCLCLDGHDTDLAGFCGRDNSAGNCAGNTSTACGPTPETIE